MGNKIGGLVIPHGRLYITDDHICFSSNILGAKNTVVVKFSDVKSIQKAKIMGIFDSGIEIVL